nr:hypothetical protein [Tanacetum cinerariifolium]
MIQILKLHSENIHAIHDKVLSNLLIVQSLQEQIMVVASSVNYLNFDTINDLARKDLNDVVEIWNRTLLEAARTMLIFSKALVFLWAKAVTTACVAAEPTIKDNPFAQAEDDPFINVFAPEPSSEESSSADDNFMIQILKLHSENIHAIHDKVLSNLLIVQSLQEQIMVVASSVNYLNFDTINDLARKDLVRGLPRLKFEKDHLCSTCQLRKSMKYAHKPKSKNIIMEVLHTIHMDLYGPIRVQSINGKKYILVIVDDYSRFTWVMFLRSKHETPEFVIKFLKHVQGGLNKTVIYIQMDNGT